MTLRILFEGGRTGPWRVTGTRIVKGIGLAPVDRLAVSVADHKGTPAPEAGWRLQGACSNLRYTTSSESQALRSIQPELGRGDANHATLIPIRKSQAWWDLAQDERRAIFEETSHHTKIGMRYLPAIARRLHHSRDLDEPFDFLTWFEFVPGDEPAFDDLLEQLRATYEWTYVEREVEIRLIREARAV